MSTIQYSARSGPLCVHKLFTSCIWWCLVSRACDWVMSALSAVILIFSFQFRSTFLPCRSARQHSGVLGLPNIRHRTLRNFFLRFWKNDHHSKIFKIMFRKFSPPHRSTFLCSNVLKFVRREIGEIVRYLPAPKSSWWVTTYVGKLSATRPVN